METSRWNIYKNYFTGSSSCSFVITKILKLHQLPLTDTLKYSLKLKVGTIFFLWVTMNYLKHAAYMTLVQCGCRATGIVLQRNMGAHNKEVLSDMSLHW
jgi:hypothetical protein